MVPACLRRPCCCCCCGLSESKPRGLTLAIFSGDEGGGEGGENVNARVFYDDTCRHAYWIAHVTSAARCRNIHPQSIISNTRASKQCSLTCQTVLLTPSCLQAAATVAQNLLRCRPGGIHRRHWRNPTTPRDPAAYQTPPSDARRRTILSRRRRSLLLHLHHQLP